VVESESSNPRHMCARNPVGDLKERLVMPEGKPSESLVERILIFL
jgi:hypothetical protein